MLGNRGALSRIQCINCNICVNTLRRYRAFELDRRVTTLIGNWVYPQIITENEYVCETCRDHAMFSVNQSLHIVSGSDGIPGPSSQGRSNVCLLCRRFTLQRQSDRLLRGNPTKRHKLMYDIIECRVSPRRITSSDRVCHACWLRTQREASRMEIHDVNRPLSSVEETMSEEEPEASGQLEGQSAINRRPNSDGLTSLNYRERIIRKKRCAFPEYRNETLSTISDKLRAMVISNHKYYLQFAVNI